MEILESYLIIILTLSKAINISVLLGNWPCNHCSLVTLGKQQMQQVTSNYLK